MQIKNIAGYKFVAINDRATLRENMLGTCYDLNIKGTILLSHEGINLNLAGQADAIDRFIQAIHSDMRFQDIIFKISYSCEIPFQRMKVKLKNEIITMRKPEADPLIGRAPSIEPEALKKWLDEKRDISILDTRNDYEVRFGTFDGAQNLHIDDFGEFPEACKQVNKDKPVVMFCTGGVRCEKAAIYLMNHGAKEVYQLEGGILNYFEKVGGAHYNGSCFVFDERVALNPQLEAAEVCQCPLCQGPHANNSACTCQPAASTL